MASDVLGIAAGEIGVTEYPPNSNNVKYNTWMYGKEVSGSAFPWCMAFVQWCYNKAGKRLPYITASCSGLLNWYKANRPECITAKPVAGDIVIYSFGHTGIFESSSGDYITAIEGNTSAGDSGSQSNGGGVFRRKRKKSTVTAYIHPEGVKITPEPIKEEEDTMTGEEIYKALKEYLGGQTVPEWAKAEFQEAIDAGITDGSNPCGLIPRYQAAIMAYRASK
jgi:hypothetical protein